MAQDRAANSKNEPEKPAASTYAARFAAASDSRKNRMPCVHPMPAWQNNAGIVAFWNKGDGRRLLLPCGTCIACHKSKAQGWALRCLLENQQHHSAVFTTLTYDNEHEPLTLQPRHLQLFHKRLRKDLAKQKRRIRQFASGEYGEQNGRPHYHDIIFGAHAEHDKQRIQDAWRMGNAYTVAVTPSAIGYTAGYCAKKYNAVKGINHERIDYTTGEIYTWRHEFIQMSRQPGIASHARELTNSWKDYAVLNGTRMPVPTYLHQAWEEIATEADKEEHEIEKYFRSLTKERITTKHLEAQELILKATQRLQAAKRKL